MPPAMAEALQEAPIRRISAVTYVETAVVADNDRNPLLSRRFDGLVREAQILVEPVTARQAELTARPTWISARAGTKLDSTWGIALRTRWQRRWTSRCYSRVMIFATPILRLPRT